VKRSAASYKKVKNNLPHVIVKWLQKTGRKNASPENRTRTYCMASSNSTIRPVMPARAYYSII
ncbi:hypothetical protein THOM_1823, partial [Trachipleistophora hominis]